VGWKFCANPWLLATFPVVENTGENAEVWHEIDAIARRTVVTFIIMMENIREGGRRSASAVKPPEWNLVTQTCRKHQQTSEMDTETEKEEKQTSKLKN
jgi:hypothetical protein